MFDYFTPVTGTLGGSLIGLSSASLLLFNGDILGASGLMSSVFATPKKALTDPTYLWKFALLATFMVTSALMPQFSSDSRSGSDPSVPIPSAFAYTVAGFLVGFGTRMGNGCTSGHGVCGLGRLSPRSFVAVLTFMATGVATAILTAPTSSLANYTTILRTNEPMAMNAILGYVATLLMVVALLTVVVNSHGKFSVDDKKTVFGAVLAGALFAAGLAISGMVLPSKLFTFLDFASIADGSWDPTLMTVLGSAIPVSFLAYQWVPNFGVISGSSKMALSQPINSPAFHVPTNRQIDFNLLMGEAIFGIGWGLGLLCPGPALYHVAIGDPMVIFLWLPAFVAGSSLALEAKSKQH
mmetsp:Transcript_24172/g.42479  ORF Transcript_24172/g.42479 Transcript_24172/m.42479 type:complete len:353 (-) Transcript_24172:124-1182(-)